jgi:transcriptional regulator with XRE-family HTH domain
MNDNAIGQNIRLLRKARQWTQEELAVHSGVDVRTIQRAERGQPLALESLRALAASFDVTVEALSMSHEEATRLNEDFRKNYSSIPLEPLTEKTAVNELLGHHLFSLERVGQLSDEQADLLAELEQMFEDCLDIWGEVGAIRRREYEQTIHDLIGSLRASGVSLSYGSEKMNLKLPVVGDLKPADPNAVMRWRALWVVAVAKESPLRMLVREKGQGIGLR